MDGVIKAEVDEHLNRAIDGVYASAGPSMVLGEIRMVMALLDIPEHKVIEQEAQ